MKFYSLYVKIIFIHMYNFIACFILARVNQQPRVHHAGWMASGWETHFHCIPNMN